MPWLIHRWLTLFGISVLVFKGCHSFFLRHTQSEKCIAAGSSTMIPEDANGRHYWAEMVDNCLNDSARFRYLDTNLLHNIKTGGTLASAYSNTKYKKRLFIYDGKNQDGQAFENNAKHSLKQRNYRSLFLYDSTVNSCAQPNGTYVDQKKDGCKNAAEQKFTFGSVTQYNAKMEDVHCSPDQRMVVHRADYGDFNSGGTFNIAANIDSTCSLLTNCQVKSRCGGNRSCELTMDNNLLPSEYCSDTLKEIYTKYTCVDTYNSSTITLEKVRILKLSNLNRGFIVIHDGSTWRRVVEENWDKNRQKMLCQHFGFEETSDNKIVTKPLGGEQNIATGDLICYNTIQPSGISCCIHLQPSRPPRETTTQFPDVQCKICDKPLLQDAKTFPDSVFNGSGDPHDNYKRARITRSGWCPRGPGTRYLMLDLQNQYHITQVVVMADNGQRWWSGSYSLKHSHDKTLVDGSTAISINGNKYGYRASTTSLNIYYVRYIKIQSTENQNFCLRIELCGEVQTPAPVKNINVSPSDYSARVTWEIPTAPQDSSYITHFRFFLDGRFRKHISRAMYGTAFNVLPLKPNTEYTVKMDTEDGSLQRGTPVTKTFTTRQAEPVNLLALSYSSLNVTIAKPPAYIKEVMVIVQIDSNNSKPTESLRGHNLKPYQANTQDPYITAYLKTDALPLTFVIGDGKEYNSEKQKYLNQPLKQNTSYIAFLRFFENQNSYYSTEWSNTTRTFAKPPAPYSLKIISTSLKMYTISWSIPDPQTIRRYYANYSASNESSKMLNISREMTSVTVAVEFDKRYTFQIQIETEAYRRSDITSETWLSHSAPLKPANKTDDGYTVILRKPRKEEKIKNVTLVLLKSESGKPPAPEVVQLKMSVPSKEEDNVAFRVKEFNITEFKNDTIEISLRESKDNRRMKRAIEVYALASDATYRTAQLNTDESGNLIWSYWSEPFTVPKVLLTTTSTPSPDENSTPEGQIDNNNNGGGDGGGSAGAVVGASVAVVIVVVAVVLAVMYFRRRRTHKRHEDEEIQDSMKEMKGIENEYIVDPNVAKPDDEGIYSNEADDTKEKEYPPVPVAEFAHYVNELKANDNCELRKQYDDLPKNIKTSWEVAKKPFNKNKNRYGNIVTYDHCRVVLSGDENEDYINASYIDGIKENSYIASQGPKELTVSDMWRMVWEQCSYSIVMVTALVELGKPKCEKYWPDKGTEKYGDIEVTLMKIEEFAYYVTHILQLKKDGEEREVRHYYFQSWPDHGVPKYPTQLLAFRRHYRTHHLNQSGPIVVHCSAGVGRTGVFLAIDTILDKLEKGAINSIDVFGQVCAMRERRMHMVQTLGQYIFVHEAILETILCGMNEVNSGKIQEEIKKLAEEKASGITGFQEKFKRLGEVSPKLSPDECTAALLEGNYNKNRNKNIYPAESNRVPLEYVSGVENSDYINAAFVHGYLGRNYFIATQTPLPNTINDFWRLVHAQKSSTIVLLNNVKDETSFPRFWPTNTGEPTQYDSLTVQMDSETETDGIWTRKFVLSPYPDLSDGQVVNIFHYTKWADHRVPSNADGIISLTSLVENSRKNHGQQPIIVACSDGAGRTGTYIAISNLLERMKIEQAMDVFQAIKIIRGTRPQFVENAEQYQFCYTTIMTYLNAFSEYANFE